MDVLIRYILGHCCCRLLAIRSVNRSNTLCRRRCRIHSNACHDFVLEVVDSWIMYRRIEEGSSDSDNSSNRILITMKYKTDRLTSTHKVP